MPEQRERELRPTPRVKSRICFLSGGGWLQAFGLELSERGERRKGCLASQAKVGEGGQNGKLGTIN